MITKKINIEKRNRRAQRRLANRVHELVRTHKNSKFIKLINRENFPLNFENYSIPRLAAIVDNAEIMNYVIQSLEKDSLFSPSIMNYEMLKSCAAYNSFKVLSLLHDKYNLDFNIEDDTNSPFMLRIAAVKGNYQMVDWLLRHGARADAVNSDAIRCAILANNIVILNLLVAYGANPNQQIDSCNKIFDMAKDSLRTIKLSWDNILECIETEEWSNMETPTQKLEFLYTNFNKKTQTLINDILDTSSKSEHVKNISLP
jgi:hypothetical protein